ncbi:MAG: nucleotide exchange factor GrpE [Candidatus Neomarinimicrobiota bacterium]
MSAEPVDKSKQKEVSESNVSNTGTEAIPKKKKIVTEKKLIADLRQEVQDLGEKNLRLRAEFDNYRRRKDLEFIKLLEYEGDSIFRAILPVMDDLERVESALADSGGSIKKTAQGISLVIAKFRKILEERGVSAFVSVGALLDSNFHDAMMVLQQPDKQDNEIIQEHEKGYKYKDKVLRHAKVVVNKL